MATWMLLHAHDMHTTRHHAVLATFLALAVSGLITDIFKHFVGKQRPNFYATVALGDEQDIRKSHFDYPSGHASSSFAGLGVAFFYAVGKMQVFKQGPGAVWKLTLALVLMGVAGYVGTSRIVDYRHDPHSVNAGAFIGLSMAALFYHV